MLQTTPEPYIHVGSMHAPQECVKVVWSGAPRGGALRLLNNFTFESVAGAVRLVWLVGGFTPRITDEG